MSNKLKAKKDMKFITIVEDLILLILSYFTLQVLSQTAGPGTTYWQSPDCGKYSKTNDIRTTVPWMVAIYTRRGLQEEFKYLTSGVIISPTMVLSVAGGVYGSSPKSSRAMEYSLIRPENVKIKAGGKTNDLEELDEFIQYSDVSYLLPNMEDPPDDLTQFHLLMYHLKTPLIFTSYVRSVCIPLVLQSLKLTSYEVPLHQVGFLHVSSENKSSKRRGMELKRLSAISLTKSQCSAAQRYYYGNSSDYIMCSKLSGDEKFTNHSCQGHGAAVIYYLEYRQLGLFAGIVSLIPGRKKGQCNENNVYLYSLKVKSFKWITQNLKCGSSNFACGDGSCIPLEKVCDSKPDCSDSLDEQEIFCSATNRCRKLKNAHRCGFLGRCISDKYRCDGITQCEDGSDETPAICNNTLTNKSKTDISCPAVTLTEGVRAMCMNTQEGKIIDCENSVPFGSVAVLTCDEIYASRFSRTSLKLTCGENGRWIGLRNFVCDLECGTVTDTQVSSQKSFEIPWHAVIYKFTRGHYDLICSATLIERSFLLTAASCVSAIDEDQSTSQNYKVVISPSSSDYIENTKDSFTQILNIKLVWLSTLVMKVPGPEDDSRIAIVKTSTPADFGDYVRPACYLSSVRSSNRMPLDGVSGLVPTVETTASLDKSSKLKYIKLSVITDQNCVGSNLCASQEDKITNIFDKDIGGGLIFQQQGRSSNHDRYVIKGILISSLKKLTPTHHLPSLNGTESMNNPKLVFARIDSNADWIIDVLERYS